MKRPNSARPARQVAALTALLLVLTVVPSAQAAAKKPWEKIPVPELNSFAMPAYERVELPSGMVVYLAEDHEFPLVELSATIDAGSIYEAADLLGLAEMTGSVMRTGGTATNSGDKIDQLVEARGMAVETAIGQTEGTAYLSALKEDTDLGLELLADILRNPVFPEDKIKLAREEQKAEISRRNDDPMTIARRESSKVVFGADHPLARSTEYATVAKITRQDMLDFHATYFHPDRMYLVVVGDFNSGEMVKKIEAAFAGWAKADKPLPADPEIPDFPRTVNVVDKDDLTQTTVFMGARGIRADDPHYAGVQVANKILGGGFATRLFNEVRSRQGLAYSVGSMPGTGWRYPGMFAAFTMTKSESSQKATAAILQEIQRMVTEPVSETELAQAKDNILNSEVFNYDSKREILDRLVMFERFGYPADFLQTYLQQVRALTPQAVLTAAQSAWHPERLSILAVGNYKEFDGDFTTFGPVTQVDITIPEPVFEVPAATPASLEQGRQAMDRAIVAAGGAAKFAGMKAYFEKTILDAKIQGMDLTFTIEKTVSYPDKVHTVQKTPFGNMTSVVAGDIGWADSPRGKQDMPADDLAKAREELRTDMVGIMREPGAFTFQALEPKDVDGKACLPVYVTGVGEDYRIIYFSAETGLPLLVEQPGTSPMSGAPVTQKAYIDEYGTFGGFTMPKAMRLVFDDEEFAKGRIEAFTVNPKVDPALFVKK
ncbi:MAG: insulinase family protein [bacterium]|nr:insulinase family protein [bacterium]